MRTEARFPVPDIRRSPIRRLIAFCLLALLAAGSAAADESDPASATADVPAAPEPAADDPAPTSPPADEVDSFRPPRSELAKSDWLRLKSGEWLKGKIEHMRDGDLEFDSAELDDLEIDFDDIAELHSPHPNRYVFEGRDVIVGTAVMRDGTITVVVAGEPQRQPRSQLIAILEGEIRERNFWNLGIGFGVTGRSGNTDSLDMSGNVDIKRETARTRWTTRYIGAFATLDGDANTNNHRVRSKFDWYLTPRLYLTPAWLEFFSDRFQNIDYRLTPATGLGYEIFKRKSITWETFGALGYQYTRFRTNESKGTFVTVLGTTFEADITKYLEFDFLYSVALGIPDVSQTTHHSETALSFDIWGPLDFDVSLIFDRQEDPQPDDDGDTPDKNDLKLIVGLGLDF